VHCDTNEEINCDTKTNSLHAVNSTRNQLENSNCIKWNLHEPIYHIQSTETQKQTALMVQSLTKTVIWCIFTNGFFTPKHSKHIMGWVSKLSMTVQFILRRNFVPRTIQIHMQIKQLIKIHTKCRNNNTKVLCQNTNITLDKKCFETHHVPNAHQG
jgi:hypothetical protein